MEFWTENVWSMGERKAPEMTSWFWLEQPEGRVELPSTEMWIIPDGSDLAKSWGRGCHQKSLRYAELEKAIRHSNKDTNREGFTLRVQILESSAEGTEKRSHPRDELSMTSYNFQGDARSRQTIL